MTVTKMVALSVAALLLSSFLTITVAVAQQDEDATPTPTPTPTPEAPPAVGLGG